MKNILIALTVVILVSCGASISTKLVDKSFQKLDDKSEIIILDKDDLVPTNSVLIGDVKIGDSGFTTDCGYNKVINEATTAAKTSGANIIHVIEVKKPSAFGSTCYRIKAKLYRNFNGESLLNISEIRKQKNKSRLPKDANYALIHFYRPDSYYGSLLGYKIKVDNDSIIGRLRNGEKFIYKTQKTGAQVFYGALETKEQIKLDIEKGKEYFVRCSVNMGVVLGRPEINIIENYIGMKEFDEMNK